MTCGSCVVSQEGFYIHVSNDERIDSLRHDMRREMDIQVYESDAFFIARHLFFADFDYWKERFKVYLWEIQHAEILPNGRLVIGDRIDVSELERQSSLLWVRDIIYHDRLRMMYQPIVQVKKRQIELLGHEFLVRGLTENGETIPAYTLFEAAKSQDQIFQLDKACRLAAIQAAQKAPSDSLFFINFIPTAIYDPEHCLQTTVAAIENTSLQPEQFIFEVVETEKVEDVDHLKRILQFYRKKGFRYALDDVGQGYHPLDAILDLHPDIVKLDRAFVSHVDEEIDKQQVAIRLAEMAKEMNITILAEGIERQEEGLWLEQHGYQWQQGYFYGRPEHSFKKKGEYNEYL